MPGNVHARIDTYPKHVQARMQAPMFQLTEALPPTSLKHCLRVALRYHEVKQLPLLGA